MLTPAEIWKRVDDHEYKGDNLVMAAAIYDAAVHDGGRFTVEGLASDWKLDEEAIAALTQAVREGWGSRWPEDRSGEDRRHG